MADVAGDTHVICGKTKQAQPLVCLPMARYTDDMTQKIVICYDCRIEQPGGEAAVKTFYEQVPTGKTNG